MLQIFRTIRGSFAIFLYILNMLIVGFIALIFSFIIWLIPFKKIHHIGFSMVQHIAVFWATVNSWIMELSSYKKWDIQGTGELDTKGWYILISNHCSWLDILVLGYVFRHKTPLMKFFMKKELLWTLPLGGLVCYFLGFPFMSRHSPDQLRKNPNLRGKDIETTRTACKKFKDFPSTIINFVEGSRFAKTKHKRQKSPFKYLLKPKAGGTAIVLQEMNPLLNGLLDVTLYYKAKHFSFWKFVCGDFEKIYVRYTLLPINQNLIGSYYQDRQFRIHFQQWLNALWLNKDILIEELHNKPS